MKIAGWILLFAGAGFLVLCAIKLFGGEPTSTKDKLQAAAGLAMSGVFMGSVGVKLVKKAKHPLHGKSIPTRNRQRQSG